MSVFTPSQTIPGEYYLGDYPGTLQYKIQSTTILEAMKTLDIIHGDLECGFRLVQDSVEQEKLGLAIIPDTTTGNANSWTPLVIMRKDITEHEVWLKAALRNNDTNEIALITSTNSYDTLMNHGSRGIHSHDPDWVIGHYRMVAPRAFWIELAKKLDN